MLKSLFSGVSGMRSNQTKMDVIGNNIANVNTTAFKSGRVTFKDMLSQTIQGANAPADKRGGSNPKQVGIGTSIASTDTNMNQGNLQPTGRPTDVAIEGNGLFIVFDGIDRRFTRDGSFSLDKDGTLITSDGYIVQGFMGDKTNDITEVNKTVNMKIEMVNKDKQNLTSFGISKDGTINAIYGDTTVKVGQILIANFPNTAGLEKLGNNIYSKSLNSGDATLGTPASPGYGKLNQGVLESSNVDLANEFTDMIVTSRAFQANSKTITTSDEMLQELINLKR